MPRLVHRAAALLLACAGLCFGLKQVQTEHFVVVFQEGQEYYAHEVIRAAESVWGDLAAAYDIMEHYQRVYIYIEDQGDYADGYSIPSRNKVTIGTTPLEIGIRSSDNWVRNVVTHELAHIFSIKAANRDGFFKNFSVGRVSQYQNPNWSVAFHYRDLAAPQWWVEGLAQYESWKNGGDHWDTHRDMFLRMAVLENDLLDYAEMSSFDSRSGIYPEMTYNQGFSMVRFIDSTYGEQAVRRSASAKSYWNFGHSLRRATGHGGQDLHRQWLQSVWARYAPVAAAVNADLREGEQVFDGGYWDYYGAYSPDGSKLAFISNKGYDVLYTHLFVLDRASGRLQQVRTHLMTPAGSADGPRAAAGVSSAGRFVPDLRQPDIGPVGVAGGPVVSSRVQWSADGKRLVYSRWSTGTAFEDVYLYDLAKTEERQLTWQARAREPAFSPDGKTIAYIHNEGGTENLTLVGADGRNSRQLTNFNNGTQLYSPCWTPDGKRIVLGIVQGGNRDIATVKADAVPFDRFRKLTDSTFFPDSLSYQEDLDFMLLVHTRADERDPCLSPDGKYVYFSSDRSGIFNIYRMSFSTWQVEQVTNVLGGAFAPSVSADGSRLLYTGFHAANYSIYELKLDAVGRPALKLAWERRDFSKRLTDPFVFAADPKNGQYRLADYKPRLTLWEFHPFLTWQPAYITDSVGSFQTRLGVDLALGELHGNASMGGSLYVGKDFHNGAGPSWGVDGFVDLKVPSLFGENSTLKPRASVFGAHEVVRGEDVFEPDYVDGRTDWAATPPNQLSMSVAPDTLIGVYLDFTGGEYRDERVFTQYGAVGSLDLNRYNSVALYYSGLSDYVNGAIYGERARWQGRLFHLAAPGTFDGSTDVTTPADTRLLDSLLNTDTGLVDLPRLYDRFNVYAEQRLGAAWQFTRIRPGSFVPKRVDYLGLGMQFVRSDLTLDAYSGGSDTLLPVRDRDLYVNFGPDGQQVAQVTAVEDQRDYFRLELSGLERVPLPGNRAMERLPRGVRCGHFLTLSAFVGSTNRSLPDGVTAYPLQYRVAQFLKAYPYSFDPIDPVYAVGRFGALNTATDQTDSISYTYLADAADRDIMVGNSVAWYSAEYTLELLRGASVTPLGVLFKGLYLTPFFETANVWNRDWRDFTVDDLAPLTQHGAHDGLSWRDGFLRDAGIRAEAAFMFAHTWECLVSFTWAHRLDLDNAVVRIDSDGIMYGLDRDRFSLEVHVW